MSASSVSPRRVGKALFRAARAMLTHDTPRDAGSISYFSLIALFPSILVLIAVVDAFLGWLDLHNLVVKAIAALFPGSRSFLETNLTEVTNPSPALLVSCTLAVLWLSTWIFSSMENALNRAWHVPKRRSFWESRVRSIMLMILGGVLLLISAALTGAVGAWRWSTDKVPGYAQDQIINWMWSSIALGGGLVIAIVVFFCVYKLMPDRHVPWREAISGAMVAAFLWEAGSYLFARLLPAFDAQKVYGKTGALIALLVWVYTSSLILLFGANFSAQLHKPLEDEINPKAAADSRRERSRPESSRIHTFPRSR